MSHFYPWQYDAWQQIRHINNWPHALLLYGPAGIGKAQFATVLAQSLLCDHPLSDGTPCGECHSCYLFQQYTHPDYCCICPENIAARMLIDLTVLEQDERENTTKTVKTLSKDILIDQIRQLNPFLTTSTHREGRRVILIYPAEAMNIAAANALLKSLEEPPLDTLFILVTSQINALLPTILSRCHQYALPLPEENSALTWLLEKGVTDADLRLKEYGGAPLLTWEAFEAGHFTQQDVLLDYLVDPTYVKLDHVVEQLQKVKLVDVLIWVQRWLYDIFSYKQAGRVRYFYKYQDMIIKLAQEMDLSILLKLIASTTQKQKAAEHPLSPKLFIEGLLLEYSEHCIHVK